MLLAVSGLALIVWVCVLLLPWQAHRMRERIGASPGPVSLADVTVLIPARNEAAVLEKTLTALCRQGPDLAVVVIDDESTDDTVRICAQLSAGLGRAPMSESSFAIGIELIEGSALPEGWGGKLWALEQGLAHSRRRWTLLLDADIELAPAMIPALLDSAKRRSASLVSVMAKLHCATFWEKLLVPAFILFFKLLYPFALANNPRSRVAAAAGGCILAETRALREVGAFAAIRGALIDDCSLARLMKHAGHRIWLGVSHDVRSHRRYGRLAEFWLMVSRTAFTQLRFSLLLLLLTTLAMIVLFLMPFAAIVSARPAAVLVGVLALAAMFSVCLPTIRYYRLSMAWTFGFALAGVLFLAMTWTSAINYWLGTRARWKERDYESAAR